MNENRINQIVGPGSHYYDHMSPENYRERINTPARNQEYFKQFHKPMIKHAKQRFGSPVHLLDIACGPADELDFIKYDKDVKIIATDISPNILAHTKNRLGENAEVFASDASLPAIKENVAEAGILLNAMIYMPDKMLEAMHRALRPGGQCVVNFRIYGLGQAVFDFFRKAKGKISDQKLEVRTKSGLKTFQIKVVDFSEAVNPDGSPDMAIRSIGDQLYFKDIKDIRELIKIIGFQEVGHAKFNYLAPSKIDTFTDVFTLEKPLN